MSDAPLPSSAKPPPTSPVTAALRRAGSIGLRTTTTSRSTPIGSSRRSCPKFRSRVGSLEPAAGRGHLVREFRQRGFRVAAIDIQSYENPLVPDITIGDLRSIVSVTGFNWTISNLPYRDQDALAAHLVALGARDRCGVALLTRSEWIVARKRCQLVHEHPNFAGILQLTTRPRSSENSPRHNFVWAIWGANPRLPGADPSVRFAGRPLPQPARQIED